MKRWLVAFEDTRTALIIEFNVPALTAWDAHILAVQDPRISPPAFGDCCISRTNA